MAFIMGFCLRCKASFIVHSGDGDAASRCCTALCKRGAKRRRYKDNVKALDKKPDSQEQEQKPRSKECQVPTKRFYLTQQAAVNAAVAMTRMWGHILYPYDNCRCGRWHLTTECHRRWELLLPEEFHRPL